MINDYWFWIAVGDADLNGFGIKFGMTLHHKGAGQAQDKVVLIVKGKIATALPKAKVSGPRNEIPCGAR